MEPHAQPQQTWSPLQFRSASLTPLTIPTANQAVRDGLGELFMRDSGHLVDFKAHSVLCVEALNGGLIQNADLEPLSERADGYALYMVTNRVVKAIESRVRFKAAHLVSDVDAKVQQLARPFADIKYASGIALAVAEAGLLHDSVLAPIIANGPDCGIELLEAAQTALDELWPAPQREERVKEGSKVYTYIPFHTVIDGGFFYFTACERNVFNFNWPEITDETLEVHILLCKTLDAMSTYMIPFHMPCSAIGPSAQYSFNASETYEEFRKDIVGRSKDEVISFLRGVENFDGQDWLGMELSESDDDETLERVADLLLEMADIETNFTYLLSRDGDDRVRKAEMFDLRAQLKDLITAADAPYAELYKVLDDALASCIELVDTHKSISELLGDYADAQGDDNYGFGYENSPDRFFNCIWVLASGRHNRAEIDGLEAFNAEMQECEAIVKLPLESGEVVARVTIPIIERTNQCLALLRRIELSLEAV